MLKRRKVSAGDENLWLISYSDLITSILAVLVLVMSFSKIDIEKIDHANRLMKDDSLMTLSQLQKEYKKILKENNLKKFVNIFLNEDGLHINMSATVQFDPNSARLDKKGIRMLQPVFEQIIKDSKQREIVIAGHTDDTGTPQRNWELSSERADAVMLYLMKKGLNYKHSRIVAYGSNQPYKSDQNLTKSQQRKLDRRVTILIGRSYKKGKE
jgi:outer membrane protein OmpA-like peptidoglycan-associated protein